MSLFCTERFFVNFIIQIGHRFKGYMKIYNISFLSKYSLNYVTYWIGNYRIVRYYALSYLDYNIKIITIIFSYKNKNLKIFFNFYFVSFVFSYHHCLSKINPFDLIRMVKIICFIFLFFDFKFLTM